MSANRIVHPEAVSTAPGRVAAIVLTSALIVIAVVGGALVTLRDNDDSLPPTSASGGSSSVSSRGDSPDPDVFPDLPADPIAGSRRRIVVVASVDDIASVSALPGMEVPGIATEYLVVNDEMSQSKFDELLRSLAEPGARPTSVIDFR